MNDELLIFARGSLKSVWAVELLLLLRRSRPRQWDAGELAEEMAASSPMVAECLSNLEAAGLTAPTATGRYGYAPASIELDEMAGRLESAYRKNPVDVVNAITGAARSNVRSFADAFRFRGGKG